MKMSIRLLVALAALLSLAGVLLATSGSASAQAAVVRVPVGDLWFCSSEFEGEECLTTINAGDTVVWDFSITSTIHTTTACTEFCNWDSGNMSGGTFSFTFDGDHGQGGFLYRCSIHPTVMMGRIEVLPAEDELTAQPDRTAQPEVVAAPSTGTGTGSSSAISQWYVAGLAMAGLLLVSGGLALVGVRRRAWARSDVSWR